MSNAESKGRAYAVVVFFTFVMAFMTFNLIVFPACAITTMEVYGIGQAEMTTLTSVTSVVGVFGGIIFGKMLDTKNIKKSIMLYMAIGVVLFFARAFITSYVPAIILTFLASLCVGIAQIAGPKVIATWFKPQNIGTAMSFLNSGAGIGSAAGFVVGGALGIGKCLFLVAILYAILLAFWIIVGGEGPYKMPLPAADENAVVQKNVKKSKNLWMIIMAFTMAAVSSQIVNSNLVLAFIGKGLEPAEASAMGTALNLSLLFGGFIMTAILGFVKKFNPLLIFAMIVSAVLILLAWFLPIGVITWVLVIAGGLIFGGSLGLCAGRIPLIPMTGDFGPEQIGAASGFNETIKGIISFILPIAVAYVFGTNYTGIFIVFAVCCVICAYCGGIAVPELGEKGALFQKTQKRD